MTGSIFLEDSQLSIGETDGTVLVPIVRSGDLSGAVVIEYGTTQDTATDGLDYLGDTGTVLMASGADRVTVSLQILDDSESEATESFGFSLINVDSGSLLFPRTARIDILDDENPVTEPPTPPLTSDFAVTQQNVIDGLSQPIAFEFAPQNPALMFIAEKGGVIKVYDLGAESFLPDFVDISSEVNNHQDRGLLDIEFHPDFPNTPYLYAFYVVDPPETVGQTGNAGPDGGGNRFSYVVRFTADESTGFTTIVPGSETILLGAAGQSLSDISGGGALDFTSQVHANLRPSDRDATTNEFIDDYLKVDSRSHAGGSIAFGPDGALYVSTGDGTSFNYADPRTKDVQEIDSLSGKILRIDPITGQGLADNPFVQPGDSLDANHAKVYQLGLRNPFSMAFDENGKLIVSETGWFSYEELNSGGPGANFGWPYYEGGDNGVLLKTPQYQNHAGAQDFYDAVANGTIEVAPAYRAFSHRDADPGFQFQAITGADSVYTGSQYPEELQNDYFFTDFSQGEVFSVDVNDRREVTFLYTSESGFGPVYFKQGPDGFMYVADFVAGVIGKLDITKPISLEVEDMSLSGLTVETLAGVSSGDQHVRISDFNAPPGTSGTATAVFGGPSGSYDVILAYYDENDGQSTIDITIGDDSSQITLDQDLAGGAASAATRTEVTVLSGISIDSGDAITLTATLDGQEFARMDVLTFQAVTIEPNDPPNAVNDPNGSTDEDNPVTIDVLANDSDPDLDPLTVTGVDTSGTQGQVSVNPDGTIDYDPGSAFQFLGQGESATDSFEYSISDGRGGADSATVTVTVDGLDEPPGPISLEVEDMNLSGLTIESLAGVSSGDQHVRISDFGAPAGTTGTASSIFTGASGSYDVILAYFDENDGQSTIDITVGDDATSILLNQDLPGGGASAATRTEATVLSGVTVNNGDAITLTGILDPFEFARMDVLTFQPTGGPANQPPTAVNDPNGSTDEDNPVAIDVLANDSDPDLDPLTVTGVDTSGTQGQVSVNPDGTIDYDPGAAFQFLSQGESATDSFEYSISDGRGGADSATVTVTVDGLDEPPGPISLEVEDMSLAGLTIETLAGVSSGDQHVRISDFGAPAGTTGTASSVFTGASGSYDVILAYFDENDGQSTIDITIGNDSSQITLDQDLAGGAASAATLTQATVLSSITIDNGDAITLTATLEGQEFARMDLLTFQPDDPLMG